VAEAEQRRYNFAEFVETRRREDGIPVDMPDGAPLVIPPGILWPEAAFEAMRAGDMAGCTRAFLGDEQYDRLIAAGGSWRIIDAIIRDHEGASAGESSASSST
jgi:hypothetical protein